MLFSATGLSNILVLIVLSERRQKCYVTKEYQFLELKKRMCTKKEDGYEQCLQTQLQQNYLVTNVNKVCGQKATSEVRMRLFLFLRNLPLNNIRKCGFWHIRH